MAGSAGLGLLLLSAFAMAGHSAVGLALAGGLVLGSLNGHMAGRTLRPELGFMITSLGRMAVLSVAAIVLAALLGGGLVFAYVISGVALAQLTLAAVAAREALRS